MIHASRRPPVDPDFREMSAETMKMPEPIIDPTTMVVESKRPRPRTNPEESASAGVAVARLDLASDTGLLPLQLAPRVEVEAATSRYSRARTAGSGAQIKSRITASESAPARYTSA